MYKGVGFVEGPVFAVTVRNPSCPQPISPTHPALVPIRMVWGCGYIIREMSFAPQFSPAILSPFSMAVESEPTHKGTGLNDHFKTGH